MNTNIKSLIDRINTGCIALLLGQNYLLPNSKGHNPLLGLIAKKYPVNANNGFNILFDFDNPTEQDNLLKYIREQKNWLLVPDGMTEVFDMPWKSIFTSSIDDKLSSLLETEEREVIEVYNNNSSDYDRYKRKLELNYLFGSASGLDGSKPPFKVIDKKRKVDSAIEKLKVKIPEIITIKGVLIIDGIAENDWLSFENLDTVIQKTGDKQVYLFNVNNSIYENDYIKEWERQGKVVCYKESFVEIFYSIKKELNYDNVIDRLDDGEKIIKIGNRFIGIPKAHYNAITQVASLIHEQLFDTFSNATKIDFENFISGTQSTPKWFGYKKELAFPRTAYSELKTKIKNKIDNNDRNKPLIVSGQTCSGKTILLGQLAYDYYQQGVPVLFIDRTRRIDNNRITTFCQWIEGRGAEFVLIIWDGNQTKREYNALLRYLNTLGRKVIIVGSCYTTQDSTSSNKQDEVNLEIKLNENEKSALTNLLSKYYGATNHRIDSIVKNNSEKNFLTLLWRYLVDTKTTVKEGLSRERGYAIEKANNFFTEKTPNNPTTLGILLEELRSSFSTDTDSPENTDDTNGTQNSSEYFINVIMVPSQFGFFIPYDILIRMLDLYSLNELKHILAQETNIIVWEENQIGETFLRSRNQLEAQIILETLEKRKQLSIIIDLIKCVADSRESEVEFAVLLLQRIGPSYKGESISFFDNNSKESAYYEIADNIQSQHPRMVLQKASYLREAAKLSEDAALSERRLNEAEDCLRTTLEQVNRVDRIRPILQTELSVILCTKIRNKGVADFDDIEYQNALDAITIAFNSVVDIDYPLSTLAWFLSSVYAKLNDSLKEDVCYKALTLFNKAENMDLSEESSNSIDESKYTIFKLLDKDADGIIQKLIEKKSPKGYFIKAKYMVKDARFKPIDTDELDRKSLQMWSSVYEYLFKHDAIITTDTECSVLYFKSWWATKTRHSFLFKENKCLNFNENDWQKCKRLLDLILKSEENSYPVFKYLYAICLFHLGEEFSFKEIGRTAEYSQIGNARVKPWYYATDFGYSQPKIYQGRVETIDADRNSFNSRIYIQGLDKSVEFKTADFERESIPLTIGGSVECNIAFSFTRLIIKPKKNG
jgi:hypothetical protein